MPRLLLVDDEPDFLTLTRLILEDEGSYEVVGQAADGGQAIDEARRLQPDVILLDLNMPRMGGLEALPRLRAVSPASLVVVVSVARDQRELHQAKMAGAHAFIDKALSNDEFVEALNEVLSKAAWTEHRRGSFDVAAGFTH